MKKVALFVCCLLLAAAQGTANRHVMSKLRIVNGNDATLGEIPYQVHLQDHFGHFCGGSIVNEYWVVTATHCLTKRSTAIIRVSVGSIDQRESYSVHNAEEIILHEKYKPAELFISPNDIGLIKVTTPFEFSFRIQPATLPEPHAKVNANSTAIVSGWGNTHNNTESTILQKATVYVTDQKVCQKILWDSYLIIYPTQICANDPSKRTGGCKGDSGGPLTVDGVLTGIVSGTTYDDGCGSPRYPLVFTRISEYVDWIKEHVK